MDHYITHRDGRIFPLVARCETAAESRAIARQYEADGYEVVRWSLPKFEKVGDGRGHWAWMETQNRYAVYAHR